MAPYGKGTYGKKVGRPKKKKTKKRKKRYYGTLIRETKTHKYARTHNGKTKKIKKGK